MEFIKQNKRPFIIIISVFAFFGLLAFIITLTSDDIEQPRYELNEETGREFFVDPQQAQETSEVDTVTLFKAEELIDYIYGDLYSQMTIKMTKYLWDNVSEDVVFVYVDSSVTRDVEQQIVFEFKTTEPSVTRHKATVYITPLDTLQTTFEPI